MLCGNLRISHLNLTLTLYISACFDVYNIETALPVIDMEAIEAHLEKAKEEEKKVRFI